MAVLYNQELISLLAKPLVLALQQRRQEVVRAIMDVLVKEAALDQGDMLADALLLLAYQVGGLQVCGYGQSQSGMMQNQHTAARADMGCVKQGVSCLGVRRDNYAGEVSGNAAG